MNAEELEQLRDEAKQLRADFEEAKKRYDEEWWEEEKKRHQRWDADFERRLAEGELRLSRLHTDPEDKQ